MGNFIGHILPGSLFIIFSILWAINMLRFHFNNIKRKHGLNENLYFESRNFNSPMESIVLVCILPIVIFGEYVTGFQNGPEICADNVQHMTMYLFFLILSIVNLMEIYSFSPLPSIVDPLYGFAFGVETLLLYFHTHGQGLIEQHLHKLLTFAAFMCSITSFLLGIFRTNVVIQLARPLFVLLQGTWFCQIAFLLYPLFSLHSIQKTSNESFNIPNNSLILNKTTSIDYHHSNKSIHLHDHEHNVHRSIMIMTAYFCWHFAFSIITMITLAFICRKKIFKKQELFIHEKYQRLLEETST